MRHSGAGPPFDSHLEWVGRAIEPDFQIRVRPLERADLSSPDPRDNRISIRGQNCMKTKTRIGIITLRRSHRLVDFLKPPIYPRAGPGWRSSKIACQRHCHACECRTLGDKCLFTSADLFDAARCENQDFSGQPTIYLHIFHSFSLILG